MEGMHKIHTGSLLKLSEQQLVSCDTSNFGCNGGDIENAFAFLATTPQVLSSLMPYTSGTGDNGSC
jgi:hypothetical protein